MREFQRGEDLARKCLEANGFDVIDRTHSPAYWEKDIDFTAIKDGRQFNIEVKWDSKIHNSGAMFLELITDTQNNQRGWANYTEADYIFYGDAKRQIFYIFAAADMRAYLQTHKAEYETREAKDYNRHTGEVKKISMGAIVPIGLFKRAVRVQELSVAERLKN